MGIGVRAIAIGEAEHEAPLAGVQVGELTPDLARSLDVPPGVRGVVITNISDPTGELGKGDVIEEVIEPYLMQQGLVMRTPRGRMLAHNGWMVLGLNPPVELQQLDMLALGAAASAGGEELEGDDA